MVVPTSSSSSSYSCSTSMMSRMKNYDVFLSFRGLDTRPNIISHLYASLDQKGIHAFKDNEKLQLGDRRSDLFNAIEGSRICIVTFSKNYARSKWCLDELQKIMELKEEGKLALLPIFYHVTPEEVRLHAKDNGEKGCYQLAMDEMEAKYGNDSETVKRWRKALWQGGDLIGIPVDQGHNEAEVVREVVGNVLKILNRHVHLEVAKYPVGIDRHLEAIRPLLYIDPHINHVYMIGLLGQGGAGKTTLSKAICNDIADRFDSWCFLPNVRETTSKDFKGLAHLQQTLLRRLLSEDGLTVSSVDEGKELIKERLQYKKVLVILDDVDESDQLDALAGNLDWFGNGSRIIITTRNYHVFDSDHVRHVYQVELLNEKEASDLFQLHAFGKNLEKLNVDSGLIDSFVEYAGGLPLALVVLGACLRDRSPTEWKEKLKELADSADEKINSVLRISFDGLEERCKEIFLDVACFFKEWKVEDVQKILDSCGFVTLLGINTLVERCLITIVYGEIQMHDLLGALGQSIALDQYSKGNGIPSRIWRYEDLQDVLLGDRERQHAVKGIVLNFSEGEEVAPIKCNDFKGFKNLRMLIVLNGYGGPKKRLRLPRELRWLQWSRCSAHTIEFDPYSKLVGLDLEDSHIQQIKEMKGFKERRHLNLFDCLGTNTGQGFEELKYVNFSWCSSLIKLPDFSKSLKLEHLKLRLCYNLTTLDEAIGSLENLVLLDLESCYELKKVPSSLRSKHLQTLSFWECSKLHTLPHIMEELTFIEKLDLSYTAVKELPDSFGKLVALKELDLLDCKELTTIHSSIYKLRALKKLNMSKCIKLLRFPQRPAGASTDGDILGFPNLESLDMENCNLKDIEFLNDLTCFQTMRSLNLSRNEFLRIPTCISKFSYLENLNLSFCEKLFEILELPNVSELLVYGCRCLKTFPSLHTFIFQSKKEYKVDLFNCLGLEKGFIDRSLPLEKVRGFSGKVDIFFPGGEFPHWVDFQSVDCGSRYRVYVPGNISEDDHLGLALFISFDSVKPDIADIICGLYFPVTVRVGGSRHWMRWEDDVDGGVHTWFLYIPCQPDKGLLDMEEVDWCNLTLEFLSLERWSKVFPVKRWGMRLLCKREEDDHRVQVQVLKEIDSG